MHGPHSSNPCLDATTQLAIIVLFTSIGTSGCLDMSGECTPADNTYSCCLKKHLADAPVVCDGVDRQIASVHSSGSPINGRVVLTAAAALTLSDINNFEVVRPEIEEVLKECAREAEKTVNDKWLGGRKPGRNDCAEELVREPDGRSVTRAMRWGQEKHEEAKKCLENRLAQRIKGHFNLEQRYRYDPRTGRKTLLNPKERAELLRQGRADELRGTLQPDVVIHSGDPLQALAVYDLKFPCPEDNEPTWSRYPPGHPYQNSSQGEVYSKAFGRPAARVAPWWGIVRSVL